MLGSRIHEGMVRGAAGPENLPAELQGWYSGRKERLRANPQTMDRDTNRRCQLTRHKRRRKSATANHPHRPGLVGSAPQTPRDLSPGCQSRRTTTETGRHRSVHRAPRLRSWPLARRSGRVSAWPYPPVRSMTILSATQARNHCRCARCPIERRLFPDPSPRARVGGRTEFGFRRDVSWVERPAPRALYAILSGRFFEDTPFWT